MALKWHVSLFVFAVLALQSVQAEKVQGCQQDAMAQCTDPLRVLTNNRDLGFATSKTELDSLCPNLLQGLRCIDNFTERCLDNQHRQFFNMLYAGTKQVIIELCQDDIYQTEYLQHAPCMREVQSGYERCAMEYQNRIQGFNDPGGMPFSSQDIEETTESSKNLCCSFQGYMNCSQDVVQFTCGQRTADFTKGFLDTMAGPLIQGYCLAYEPGTEDCLALPTSVSEAPSLKPATTTRRTSVIANDITESKRRSDFAVEEVRNGAEPFVPLSSLFIVTCFQVVSLFM